MMNAMFSIVRKAQWRGYGCLLALLLMSCGGGGGSAGSGAQIPSGPPANAAPIYTGNTAPAFLGQGNALYYGISVQESVDLVGRLVPNLFDIFLATRINSTGVINGPIVGAGVGTQAVGQLNQDGTGWLESTLSQYALEPTYIDIGGASGGAGLLRSDLNPLHQAANLSGQFVIQYLAFTGTSGSLSSNVIVSLNNLEVKGATYDFVLNGTVNASLSESGPPGVFESWYLTANISIKNKMANSDWLLSNFSIRSSAGVNSDVAVSGNLSDSNLGSVQITSDYPVHLQYLYSAGASFGPMTSGYFSMKGAGATTAYFGGLNYYFASIAVDTDGSGVPDQAQRYSWQASAPDVTSSSWTTGPIAYAGILEAPTVGTPGYLDGRYSYSPSGKFITFTWSLMLTPAGADAQFDNDHSATPEFTVSQPGQYLVKLQVSDGTYSATDYEVVTAPQIGTNAEQPVIYTSMSGPAFISAQIGQSVQLDGRIDNWVGINSVYPNDVDLGGPVYNWTLITPPGSAAKLSASTAASPSFTPDVDGYYVVLNDSKTNGDIFTNRTIVAVGAGFEFTPPMQFIQSGITNVAPANVFGTGREDVVASINTGTVGSYPNGTYVAIYPNLGSGGFGPGIILPGNGGGISAGDVNGDGHTDVVSSIGYGYADVILQQSNDTFGPPQALCAASPCSTEWLDGQVWISKIGNNVTNSVISQLIGPPSGLAIFNPNGSGGFEPASNVYGPTGISIMSWALGDVTGDGINDAVGVESNGNGTANLRLVVIAGNPDGTFGAPQIYSFTYTGGMGVPEMIEIADVNNDGGNDVIFSSGSQFSIFLQQPNGMLGTPITISLPPAPNAVPLPVMEDTNNDGLKDIVATDGERVYFYLQNAQHQFSTPIAYPAYQDVTNVVSGPGGQIVVTDLNGDGIPDLILPSGVVMLGISYPGTPP